MIFRGFDLPPSHLRIAITNYLELLPAGPFHQALEAIDPARLQKVIGIVRIRAPSLYVGGIWPARPGGPDAREDQFRRSHVTGLGICHGPPQHILRDEVTASDLPAALGAVTAAVANGTLTPDEGAAVASILDIQRRGIETADLEARLPALEAQDAPDR